MEQKITKKLLEEKINKKSWLFESLDKKIEEKRKEMVTIKNEIAKFVDEQKRLQGEYRLLIEMGTEFGFFTNEESSEKNENEAEDEAEDDVENEVEEYPQGRS